MKCILKFIGISLLFGYSNLLIAQTGDEALGYRWDPNKKLYQKNNMTTLRTFNFIENDRQIMTARKRIWVLGTTQKEGHWEKLKKGYVWVPATDVKKGYWEVSKSNEIKERRKIKADYLYKITNSKGLAYPKYTVRRGGIAKAPEKPFRLNKVAEHFTFLKNKAVKNVDFEGKEGSMNVYYVKKASLGLFTFAALQDHIVVIDTLHVPAAAPFSASFMSLDRNERRYVKVIANHLVYESPISISSLGIRHADFVFAAKNVHFKSPYKQLQKEALSPAPPMVYKGGNQVLHAYKDPFGMNEKLLLNRLYVKVLEQLRSKVNSTEDIWEVDKLVSEFRVYQRNKIDVDALINDTKYQEKFNGLSEWFDTKYANFKIEPIREKSGFAILANGNLAKRPIVPIQYYPIPSAAKVLPSMYATTGEMAALGNIRYQTMGDTRLKLSLDVALGHDTLLFEQAKEALGKINVKLQARISKRVLRIPRQSLKINGRSVGEIIPIDNQLLRLEIDLTEDGKSILEVFPKVGGVPFQIAMEVPGLPERIVQNINLIAPKELLARLDYKNPLVSFNVIEETNLTETVNISNKLNNESNDHEGTLNYVEVLLEFNFPNKTVVHGPFRLSPTNSFASEREIPFVKHHQKYRIVVSGRAVYENGWRDCVPFTSDKKIIMLEDNMLKKSFKN